MSIGILQNIIKNGLSENSVITDQSKESILKHIIKSLGESSHQKHQDLLNVIGDGQNSNNEIINTDSSINLVTPNQVPTTVETSTNAISIKSVDLSFEDLPVETSPYKDENSNNNAQQTNNQPSESTPIAHE
jgi:hypothetical protein